MPVMKSPSHIEIPALFRIKKQQSISSVFDKISNHRKKSTYGSLFNRLSSIREENETSCLYKLRKKPLARSPSPLPPPPPTQISESINFYCLDELPPPPKIQVLKILKTNEPKFQPPPPKLAPHTLEPFKRSNDNLISYKKDNVKVIQVESFSDSSSSSSKSSLSSIESLVHKSRYPQKPIKHVNFMPNKIQKTHHIYSSLPSIQNPLNKTINTGTYKSIMDIQLNNNVNKQTNNTLRGKRGGIIYSSLNNIPTAPLTRSPNVTLKNFKEPLQHITNNNTSQSIAKRQSSLKNGIQIDIKTKCFKQSLQQQQQQHQQHIQSVPQRQSINITNKGPPIKYIGVSIGDTCKNRHTGVLISTSNNINNKLLNPNNSLQTNGKIVNIQLKEEKLPKKSILKKSTSIKINSNSNKENLKPTTTTSNSMKNTTKTTQLKSTTKIKSDFSKLMNIDLEQELKSFHSNTSTPLNTSYNYLTSTSPTSSSLSFSSSTSSYDKKFKRIDKFKITATTSTTTTTTTNNNTLFNNNNNNNIKRNGLILNNNNKLNDFTNRLY